MKHKTQLAAKVAARNHVHALCNEYGPKLRAALKAWEGKKVVSVNGWIIEKVKASLEKVLPPDTVEQRCYLRGGKYNICAEFKVCHQFPGHYADTDVSCYAEATVYLGDIQSNSTLLAEVKAWDAEQSCYRTDYTEAEVLQARREVEAAEKALSDANSKLLHFGKYDN